MENKGLTLEQLSSMIDELPNSLECFKGLGKLLPGKKKIYQEKYEYFIYTNNNKVLNGINETEDNKIKGKALEDLVSVLFEVTGGYFNVYANIRNGTNEVDLFVEFSGKGKRLSNILDKKYSDIICECKNYGKQVGVTYIGKFYSLIQSTNNKIGIMFSYGGFSGKSWGAASGLAKKLFMLREKEEEKICILDFNQKDFKEILDGVGLFEILDKKCKELKLGIDDITKYIVKHPNESRIKENHHNVRKEAVDVKMRQM